MRYKLIQTTTLWIVYDTANRRSVRLRQKIAFSENVVCDPDLQTHGLENVVGVMWTGNE